MPATNAAKRKARRHRGPFFVIVPKHQMRAKKPQMLADPAINPPVTLTDDFAHARKFTNRAGAFRHVKGSDQLKKRFWYRRVG